MSRLRRTRPADSSLATDRWWRRSVPVKHGIAVIVLGALAVVALLVVLDHSDGGQSRKVVVKQASVRAPSHAPAPAPRRHPPASKARQTPVPPRPRAVPRPPRRPVAAPTQVGVGEIDATFTDPGRTMVVYGRRVPRSVETIIRYPTGLSGPFPLVVFGHGFAVSPTPYSMLLDAWTRAGYIVAAPIFPLENANAPGGPNEQDLVNQPADMSLVISSLQNPSTGQVARVASMIDFAAIAVAGQSDGGDTALSAAYGPARDPRIDAAVILSGAEDPFAPAFSMALDGPPLLAIQGTADTVNPPALTYSFYQQAAPPKYLLKLIGASHQAPYTEPGSDLTMVENLSVAFLNEYLKGHSQTFPQYLAAASAGPGSVLSYQQQ